MKRLTRKKLEERLEDLSQSSRHPAAKADRNRHFPFPSEIRSTETGLRASSQSQCEKEERELRVLLGAAELIANAPRLAPDASFRQSSRERVVCFARENPHPSSDGKVSRLRWRSGKLTRLIELPRSGNMPGIVRLPLFASIRRNRVLGRAAAVLFCAFVSVGLLGGVVSASASSYPGEPLYPTKLAVEEIRLRFTPDAQARTELHFQYAERRLDEIEAVSSENAPWLVESLTSSVIDNLSAIEYFNHSSPYTVNSNISPDIISTDQPSQKAANSYRDDKEAERAKRLLKRLAEASTGLSSTATGPMTPYLSAPSLTPRPASPTRSPASTEAASPQPATAPQKSSSPEDKARPTLPSISLDEHDSSESKNARTDDAHEQAPAASNALQKTAPPTVTTRPAASLEEQRSTTSSRGGQREKSDARVPSPTAAIPNSPAAALEKNQVSPRDKANDPGQGQKIEAPSKGETSSAKATPTPQPVQTPAVKEQSSKKGADLSNSIAPTSTAAPTAKPPAESQNQSRDVKKRDVKEKSKDEPQVQKEDSGSSQANQSAKGNQGNNRSK